MSTSTLAEPRRILTVVVGSRAFGLSVDGESDTDRRGVFAAPAHDFWGLGAPPTHADGPRSEEFSWELARFCRLALAANPNVLEVLYSPLVETTTPIGEELRALGPAFLSQRARTTYLQYAHAQFRKAGNTHAAGRDVKAKHLVYLLRLLYGGARMLRTGALVLDVGERREQLLSVRRGEVPFATVTTWYEQAAADFEDAARTSALPEEPDAARVDAWLISVRERDLKEAPCP
jgi:uncharacterized protein